MTKEQEKLFESNKAIIYLVMQKYYSGVYNQPHSEDFQDLEQCGFIGLWKACIYYDKSKGFKFSTLAVKMIYNEMSNCFTKLYGRPESKKREAYITGNICSLDAPSETTGLTLKTIIPSGRDLEEDTANSMLVEEILSILSEKERTVIVFKYLYSLRNKEVAKILNVSHFYVAKLTHRGKQKILLRYKGRVR